MNLHKLLILTTALMIGVISCNIMGVTDIGKITADPREYVGKTLLIDGNVREIFSLYFVKYFILEDKSGFIPVVTDRPLPRVGQKIKVTGIVDEAFSLGDQQVIVFIEKPQKKK